VEVADECRRGSSGMRREGGRKPTFNKRIPIRPRLEPLPQAIRFLLPLEFELRRLQRPVARTVCC